MITIEFSGLAALELETIEDLDDRALDALARDIELLDDRDRDGRHPCEIPLEELARRHASTSRFLAQGLELRDARLTAAIWEARRNG